MTNLLKVVVFGLAVVSPGGRALAFPQGAVEREITVTVSDAVTRAPLREVLVQLKGSQRGGLSDEKGQFSIRAPVGDATLIARRIGYRQVDHVVPSGESTADIEMDIVAIDLNAVVISGQATGVERRNLATAVTTVSGADLTRVSQQSLEHGLQGKIPGVQISQRTGAPGGGNWVKIRGVSTITGGQTTPLFVVDGVIVADTYVSNAQGFVTSGAGSESPPNRITDLDPNDIETIEVLKGPTASAIYGSKASMGVVLITTKRGRAGRVRWSVNQGFGSSRLAYRHGHRQWGYDDAIAFFGNGAAQYFDSTTKRPLLDLDYEDLGFGESPLHSDLSISASGGSADTRYFLSVAARDEGGIVDRTGAQKYSARSNVDQTLGSRAALQLGASFMRTSDDRGIFDNENGPNGIGSSVGYTIPRIPSFLDLRQRADGTWPLNPFFQSNPLQNVALSRDHDEVWRGIMTGQLRWDVLSSASHDLRFVSIAGVDALIQRFEVFMPPELQSEAVLANPGRSVVTEHRNAMANINLNAVHTWRASHSLTVTSQAGTQYERQNQDNINIGSSNIAGGLEVVNAGATTTFGLSDYRLRVEDFGLFAQTEWLWNDQLLVTAGGRADRSSANADEGKFFLFPKASISYRLDNVALPWIGGSSSVLDEVKFRMAYGETGNRPYYGDKFTGLAQGTVGGNTSYRTAQRIASPDLHPERQQELEGGIDVALLDRRTSLELTAFRRDISDLLLSGQPPPSTGYTSIYTNVGRLRTHGFEAAFSAIPVQQGPFTVTARATFGMTRSNVVQLTGDTILVFGSRLSDGQVWLRPGHSATEIMGLDTTSSTPVRIGDGAPAWTGGWSTEFRWGGFHLYALLDHQQGGRLWAGTWSIYDNNRNSSDYDVLAPDGRKLGDVRRDLATRMTALRSQDATYTKLREVTLGWDAPPGVSRWFAGARAARLQLSGRNLYWWTTFRGGDPEAENFFGGFELFQLQRNRELAAYPASRSGWVTLRLEF